MEKSTQLKRTVFGTSMALVVLNVVQGIKAFNEIFESLTKFLGSFGINTLHFTTLIGLFAGLGVLTMTFIKYRKALRQSWGYLLLGTVLIAGTGANIAWTELRTPEPRLSEKVQQWCQQILTNTVIQTNTVATNSAFPLSRHDRGCQVWTDAQLLKGLLINARRDPKLVNRDKLRSVFDWIESQRRINANGWTYMSDCRANEPSVTEIGAWVLLAQLESLALEDFWLGRQLEIDKRIERDVRELMQRQDPSGGFAPVRSKNSSHCRTYSTLMAVHALAEFKRKAKDATFKQEVSQSVHKGIAYLIDTYDTNLHSWVPNPHRAGQNEQFPGLTAQVLYVLSECDQDDFLRSNFKKYIEQCRDFINNTEISGYQPSRNQRMHDADQHIHSDQFNSCFQLEASTYLGYPWIVATLSRLEKEPELEKEREKIVGLRASFLGPETVAKGIVFVEREMYYVWAENLIGYGAALESQKIEKANLLKSQFGFKLGVLALGLAAGAFIGVGIERRQLKRVSVAAPVPESAQQV